MLSLELRAERHESRTLSIACLTLSEWIRLFATKLLMRFALLEAELLQAMTFCDNLNGAKIR